MGNALTRFAPAVVVLALGCAGGRATTGAAPASSDTTDVRRHVEFLASDALGGRQTPGRGLELAADYMRTELARYGVTPGIGGGYTQRYPFPLVAPDSARSRLVIAGRSLEYGTDFTVIAGGSRIGVTGAIQYLGRLPEAMASRRLDSLRYDRIVIMQLPGYPSERSRGVAQLARDIVARNGARGVVFLVDTLVPAGVMRRAAAQSAAPTREMAAIDDGIPTAFVRDPASVALLARGTNADIQLGAPRRIVSADSAPNVVGMVRGSDSKLRDEYVIVSAHLDHIGTTSYAGGGSDTIFNGADDNASGTSALLAIAKSLAGEPPGRRPRRSILFVSVSGEEHGLLGSQWLAAHLPVPLDRIVAVVNLDMVGRNSRDTVYAIGMEYSTLGALAVSLADTQHLQVAADPKPEQNSFMRSDQYSFVRHRIPSLFLTSGFHPDYHAVTDEPARLDVEKVARVARLAKALVRKIADAEGRPTWTPAGLQLLDRVIAPAITDTRVPELQGDGRQLLEYVAIPHVRTPSARVQRIQVPRRRQRMVVTARR